MDYFLASVGVNKNELLHGHEGTTSWDLGINVNDAKTSLFRTFDHVDVINHSNFFKVFYSKTRISMKSC